jgi:hypothetical protein
VPAFLFRFGYESPSQMDANAAHGWDDESSQWLMIDAASEDDALKWGCEVAERFISQTCGVSWKASGFAHCVELLTEGKEATTAQRVTVGQYPDFSKWT